MIVTACVNSFIEPSKYLKQPDTEEVVRFGDIATFNCGAVGSYISLTWRFDGSTLACGTNGCNNSAAIVTQEISGRDESNGNITINSQLAIDTGVLDFQSTSGASLSVDCIVRQSIPENFSVQGLNFDFRVASSLLVLCKYSIATL